VIDTAETLLKILCKTGYLGMKVESKKCREHRNTLIEAGFTLIELLVVLVIIGILAGYIGPKIMGHPEEAKRTKATMQIQGIETALKMYKLDNGMYPSTEQGLQALVEPPSIGQLPPKWRDGGYLEKGTVPLDPWGNEFVYLSPGVNGDFDLSSYAADNEAGGEGDGKDINNWEVE
jgi:general secretion pathway protein G